MVELEDAMKLDGGGTLGTLEGLCQQQLTLSTLLSLFKVDDENPEERTHTHTHTSLMSYFLFLSPLCLVFLLETR